jgi:hypothetical protein
MLTLRSGYLLPSRQYDSELAASLGLCTPDPGDPPCRTLVRACARREESTVRLGRGGTAIARVTAALVLSAGAASCSTNGRDEIPEASNENNPTSTPTSVAPVPSSTTTTGSDGIESTIEMAYRAFWDARFAANSESPSPSAPSLETVATGAQLERARAELEANRASGVAFRRPAQSIARRVVAVVKVEGNRAEVTDCSVNDGVVYRVSTGEVLSSSVSTRSLDAVMAFEGGVWKLESTTVVQEWEGEAGCALS